MKQILTAPLMTAAAALVAGTMMATPGTAIAKDAGFKHGNTITIGYRDGYRKRKNRNRYYRNRNRHRYGKRYRHRYYGNRYRNRYHYRRHYGYSPHAAFRFGPFGFSFH